MAPRRTQTQLYQAMQPLKALWALGYETFPLGVRSKHPAHKGFLLHDYKGFDYLGHLEEWGNVGVRCRRTDLIMDVDPRNGGAESLEALKWDLDCDFDAYPHVLTGSGGSHYYMTKPGEGRWRHTLRQYPGIDFQGLGRYVVGPGSVHPDTGRLYRFTVPPALVEAPASLLAFLLKPALDPNRSKAGGNFTPEQMAELLSALDPRDFGQGGKYHDEWLDIAMACHDGSKGDGLEEWLEWCAGDEQYGDDAREMNTARWESFESGRVDGVSYKTLLRAVTRAGRPRLVAGLRLEGEARNDFADEELDHF